jgi:glycosyltransferase involved in cell wall biosynthesis
MRVVHVITGLATGGAETVLFRLMEISRSRGFQLTVVSLSGGGVFAERIRELSVPVVALGMKKGGGLAESLLRLRRVIREAEPDLIQGWMYHGNIAALFAAFLFCRKIPVLWNVRHALHAPNAEKIATRFVIRLNALLSRFPARIVYNSAAGARQHEGMGFSSRRTVVIPNGFDAGIYKPDPGERKRVRRELGIPDGALVVGLVGRFHPVKAHSIFFKAASIVGARFLGVHLVCVGRGVSVENPEAAGMAAGAGLAGRVHLLGERSETAGLNAAFDVAVSASLSESFPNAVGEAMACGVPCVVTDVGDSAFLVGDTGVVVEPGNPQELVRGLTTLLELVPSKRRAMGKAARKRIVEKFSIEAMAAEYEKLYESVV